MNKTYILLIIFLAFFARSLAQLDGTIVKQSEYLAFKSNLKAENAQVFDTAQHNLDVTFSVNIYDLCQKLGDVELDKKDIEKFFETINSYFAPAGIKFQVNQYIAVGDNNYSFIKKDSALMKEVLHKHAAKDRINIYLCDRINIGNISCDAFSYYPMNTDSNSIFINKPYFFTNFLVTQLGHFMGLMNTYDGFSNTSPEPVDGSTCDESGDLICDTYPDPYTSFSFYDDACICTGNRLDQQNRYYVPSAANFMSAAGYNCKCKFTLGQYRRMYYYARNFREYLK